ncbi:MAG: DinB family protein [Bacteroidota bacterium]
MNREEIATLLEENHRDFIQYIDSLSQEEFEYAHEGKKWAPGQDLAHINTSVKPLTTMVFSVPKLMLAYKFGKANRPSKDYDSLVARYQERVSGANAVKAKGKYEPAPVSFEEKEPMLRTLDIRVKGLCKKVKKSSEKSLDKYVVPHPALGKVTLREVLYFTIYHVQHHKANVQRNLSGRVVPG